MAVIISWWHYSTLYSPMHSMIIVIPVAIFCFTGFCYILKVCRPQSINISTVILKEIIICGLRYCFWFHSVNPRFVFRSSYIDVQKIWDHRNKSYVNSFQWMLISRHATEDNGVIVKMVHNLLDTAITDITSLVRDWQHHKLKRDTVHQVFQN